MPREIYLEIMAVEKALRVVAVDSQTGVEVTFTAPANCPRSQIDDLARAKLERRLRLDQDASKAPNESTSADGRSGPGKLV